jgi:hypothetical protein
MSSTLIAALLILNLTGLFAFTAALAGVQIWHTTILTLGILTLYLIAQRRHVIPILNEAKSAGHLSLLLSVWPLATIIYSADTGLDAIGTVAMNTVLFGSAMIFTVTNGRRILLAVIILSGALTVTGLLLNAIAPDLFYNPALLAGEDVTRQGGRLSGFVLHPNIVATALVLLITTYFITSPPNLSTTRILFAWITVLCVLFTGSRSGLIALMIAVALEMLRLARTPGNSSAKYILVLLIVAAVTSIGSLFAISVVSGSIAEHMDVGELYSRLAMFSSGRLSDGGLDSDGSVALRVAAQNIYLDRLFMHPLIGHGLGADLDYRSSASFFLAAHNDILLLAVEYGVVYVAIFFTVLIKTILPSARTDPTGLAAWIFIIPLLILLITGSALNWRGFYMVIGFLAGYGILVYRESQHFVFQPYSGNTTDDRRALGVNKSP